MMPTRLLALAATLTLVLACGSSTTTPGTGSGSIQLSITPTSAAIQQGGSTQVTGTVARTDFTGDVSIAVSGQPTGMTGSVTQAPVNGGNTAQVTIAATGSTPTGVYPLTITAGGTGISSVQATFTLTVTAAGSFTITGGSASLNVVAGNTVSTTVNAARTGGFAGVITYTTTGPANVPLPTGLAAAVTATATADHNTLTATAAATLAAGSYPVVVHANATGVGEQTATVNIVVAAAPSGNVVRLDFSTCVAATKPKWVAYQDGSGPFIPVTAVNDVYTFTITSAKGAYATVAGLAAHTYVHYFAQSEAAAQLVSTQPDECVVAATGKTISVSTAGYPTSSDFSQVDIAGFGTTLSTSAPTGQLFNVPAGPQDLFAWRHNRSTPANDRVIVRRAINLADASAAPLLDFNGAESLTPISSTFTVTNTGGAPVGITSAYVTQVGAACAVNMLYFQPFTTLPVTVYGLPASAQQAADLYQVAINAQVSTSTALNLSVTAHALPTGSYALPIPIVPTVTEVTNPSPFRIVQAAFPMAGYQSAFFSYLATTNQWMTVTQSAGYLGGAATATVAGPDLSAVAGYLPAWGIPRTSGYNWAAEAIGSSGLSGGTVCADGARMFNSTVNGAGVVNF